MKRTFLPLATTVLLLAGGWSTAWSQLVLEIPISARVSAMGATGVADNSDPANVFFNPANVVGPPRVYAQGSRWDYDYFFDDVWVGSMSAGASFERRSGSRPLALGIDITYGRFNYGTSILTDDSGMRLGEFHTFEDFVSVAVGAGIVFDDRFDIRLGAATKRWRLDYGPGEVDAFAFDVGTTAALRLRLSEWSVTPALGIAVVDAGPDVEEPNGGSSPLPTRLNFGTSVRIESPTRSIGIADVPVIAVVANLEATDEIDGEDFWEDFWMALGGGAFGRGNILHARGIADDQRQGPGPGPVGVGRRAGNPGGVAPRAGGLYVHFGTGSGSCGRLGGMGVIGGSHQTSTLQLEEGRGGDVVTTRPCPNPAASLLSDD